MSNSRISQSFSISKDSSALSLAPNFQSRRCAHGWVVCAMTLNSAKPQSIYMNEVGKSHLVRESNQCAALKDLAG
jgi:hypothetical protein